MTQSLIQVGGASVTLPALFVPTPEAGKRFIEFFTANIRNPHTRRAYTRAVVDFSLWCEQAGLTALREIEPVQVAAYVETLQRGCKPKPPKIPSGFVRPHRKRLDQILAD
ncbi:site-specific integrase [Thiocystis violascens]|uniref:Site-specific recombinase XerD n=1 Tax=Thiocystis violascens (strain ATCC 17096 / DSM 198 / 6111) TaxID=765911 RepID=I3Y766_THIV6|nr:site-specific integrase [Thiocystis violascens]AFL72834.1 site-specific recombinase XerD [Thiocystis violascens DSM 198]